MIMTKLELIQQKYDVKSVDDLTDYQLWECAQSKDFVSFDTVWGLQYGFLCGYRADKTKVIKYLKKAIAENLLLQIYYDDAEGVFGVDDERPAQGFHYCGVNSDWDAVFDVRD